MVTPRGRSVAETGVKPRDTEEATATRSRKRQEASSPRASRGSTTLPIPCIQGFGLPNVRENISVALSLWLPSTWNVAGVANLV